MQYNHVHLHRNAASRERNSAWHFEFYITLNVKDDLVTYWELDWHNSVFIIQLCFVIIAIMCIQNKKKNKGTHNLSHVRREARYDIVYT